jgi:hypothetical protein
MPPKKVVVVKSGTSPVLKVQPPFKILPPALLVQEGSGDFTEWKKSKTIDGPEQSLFSFRNDRAGVTQAVWQLSSQPMPANDPSTNFPGYLGGGTFPPPPQAQARTFSADWKAFAPAEPVNGAKYYIRVIVKEGPANAAVVASNVVEITINKSKTSVVFTPKGLLQTVQQKHPELYATPSMVVQLDLNELYIGNDNESADEPYLLVAVVYLDGTTIDPFDMQNSTVRIDSAKKTHGNVSSEDASGEDLEEGSTAQIPSATGHFERTITPIGLLLAADLEDPNGALGSAIGATTAVYVVLIAMEEDSTSTEAIDAARAAFLTALRSEIEAVLHSVTLGNIVSGNLPKLDAEKFKAMEKNLKQKAIGAAEDETFFPLWWTPAVLGPFLTANVDKDDVVGFAVQKFSYSDLLAAGPAGIPFEATTSAEDLDDWEGLYTIRGTIRRK